MTELTTMTAAQLHERVAEVARQLDAAERRLAGAEQAADLAAPDEQASREAVADLARVRAERDAVSERLERLRKAMRQAEAAEADAEIAQAAGELQAREADFLSVSRQASEQRAAADERYSAAVATIDATLSEAKAAVDAAEDRLRAARDRKAALNANLVAALRAQVDAVSLELADPEWQRRLSEAEQAAARAEEGLTSCIRSGVAREHVARAEAVLAAATGELSHVRQAVDGRRARLTAERDDLLARIASLTGQA